MVDKGRIRPVLSEERTSGKGMFDESGTTTTLRTSTGTREGPEGVLYTHAMVYVFVNIMLFVINFLTPGPWWFYWPLIFWGIGLGAHALNVFGFGGRLGQDWEERKTRELMDKEER